MIREAHLEVYDLVLSVKAPLYIGSGTCYNKKEYVFLSGQRPGEGSVLLMDQQRLFSLLVKRDLVDAYESFMLGDQRELYRFLSGDCHLSLDEIRALCLYQVSVGDALERGSTLKEINAFVRDAANRVYVPGSSVKGALRTALLTAMILDEPEHDRLPDLRRGFPEGQYLHTLALKKDKNNQPVDDAVNSLLRGLYVSDSQPVPDSAMILAGKLDADVNGNVHSINLCRECIKPGTKLHFKLTLDKSVVKNALSAERLRESINTFDRFYQDAWLGFFGEPRGCAQLSYENCLLLGGGAGFATKTVAFPYLDERSAAREISQLLNRSFRKHRHEEDVTLGISPRMAKYARYQGKLYPYGLCEVSLT